VKVGGSLNVMRNRAAPAWSVAFSSRCVATRSGEAAWAMLERAESDRASQQAGRSESKAGSCGGSESRKSQ
jgi:hypothetical protein